MLRRGLCVLALVAVSFNARAGETRPRHQQIDLGPFVSYTLEAPWPRQNIVYKGLAVRLTRDGKDKGALLFDTDLLRAGAFWQGGFVNFERDVATIRDYRSVAPVGEQFAGMPPVPGAGAQNQWTSDGFKDPRTSLFGPVTKSWGRYNGLYVNGDATVLSYEIAGRAILERPAAEEKGGIEALTRTFTVAPGETPLVILLTQRENVQVDKLGGAISLTRARKDDAHAAASEKPSVEIDRVEDNWERLKMGAPTRGDWLSRTKGAKVVAVTDPAKPGAKALTKLTDGGPSKRHNDDENTEALDGGAFFLVDLTAAKDVRQIDTFSWETSVRAPQVYQVFGASGETVPPIGAAPTAAWTPIASVNTESLGKGGMHGASIHRAGAALGNFRWLLFKLAAPLRQKEGTLFCELDVFTTDDAPKFPDRGMKPGEHTLIASVGAGELGAHESGRVYVHVPASTAPLTVKVVHWHGGENWESAAKALNDWAPGENLSIHTQGGPRRWKETVETQGRLGANDKSYTVDTITLPETNPYGAWMRPGAFDFFSDGTRAALSNWSGDVWVVSGLNAGLEKLNWQRVATGIFNPLGLKIVNDQIYVLGRDQITRLVDLNGDGETDFYENFNNDVETTWNFHEFAFDLQTDKDGNFYYAKGGPVRNGGRGFERIAAHHGSILKLSPDGKKMERFATGLRAPNGISVGPEGQITTGENEGTWVPACRLNWLNAGGFAGVVDTAHRETPPQGYDQPVCWLPRDMDNSGGGQVWVTSDRWGPFKGDLLHLSYGTCSLYKVLYERVNGVVQGAVVRFPVQFEAGVMRGRFNPKDGQLYVCGVKGWQTTAARDGCFQRVRFTGKPAHMPSAWSTAKDTLTLTFTDPLLKDDVVADSFAIEQWNYLWSEAYGSAEYSVKNPGAKGRDTLPVKAATLSNDGKTVTLDVPGLQPVMQIKVRMRLTGADGAKMNYDVAGSIHALKER